MYIKGMGNISPQNTWDNSGLPTEPLRYEGEKLTCQEPDYTKYIDPKQLRRMSRIIKMGVAAGSIALKNAGVAIPNGIITGTGYGCLEDTGIFLSKMIENQEYALNPTPFIQSTHNTIGSQIALLLQCEGYNQTYTQGPFSFESALLDALMELKQSPSQSILVGGVDEITSVSHAIQKRFGIFRKHTSNLDLFAADTKGTLNGEGAAFFVVTGEHTPDVRVGIEAIETIYNCTGNALRDEVVSCFKRMKIESEDIDFVLFGKTGDKKWDAHTEFLSSSYFAKSSVGVFKHLCGEYPTASAFALWLSAKIIIENYIPDSVVVRNANRAVKQVVIFNSYFGKQHTMILLKAC
jgi:3-oxoacyl-[acyl-carrier-protein] synthase II